MMLISLVARHFNNAFVQVLRVFFDKLTAEQIRRVMVVVDAEHGRR
jgi:hypothetical protein